MLGSSAEMTWPLHKQRQGILLTRSRFWLRICECDFREQSHIVIEVQGTGPRITTLWPESLVRLLCQGCRGCRECRLLWVRFGRRWWRYLTNLAIDILGIRTDVVVLVQRRSAYSRASLCSRLRQGRASTIAIATASKVFKSKEAVLTWCNVWKIRALRHLLLGLTKHINKGILRIFGRPLRRSFFFAVPFQTNSATILVTMFPSRRKQIRNASSKHIYGPYIW